MGESLSGIVLDVMNLSVIALLVGLATFAAVRRSNPLLRWHEHGNVWTGPFRFEDLVVVFALVAFYYYHVHVSAELRDARSEEGGMGGEEASEGMVAGMLLIGILLQIAITGMLLFFLTYLRRIELTELFGIARMSVRRTVVWSVAAMVVVFPLVVLVAYGVERWMGTLGIEQPDVQEVVALFLKHQGWLVRGLTVISACAVAPVAEEIIFRGFLYPAIKRHSERFFAAIVVSAIFAAVHGTASGLAPLFVLAMCLTLAYELTGCLWVPILMHALFNSVQTVIMVTHGG